MKENFLPDAKICLPLNKSMNKAISWQTSQIYHTLSSVHWRQKRDKIVYLCKDTFCLGSQPFKVTSCGKQALYRLLVTVTLAAEDQLLKQLLSSSNEVWSTARKHSRVRWSRGFATGVTVESPLKQTAGYLVLCVPGKSERLQAKEEQGFAEAHALPWMLLVPWSWMGL